MQKVLLQKANAERSFLLRLNARAGKVRKLARKNVGELLLIVLYYFGLWRYYLFG